MSGQHKRSKYKLVIVMRTDLEMSKGKMVVQAGHASILAAHQTRIKLEARQLTNTWNEQIVYEQWLNEGQFKIVVKVRNLVELNNIAASARASNLPVAVVEDYGFTQVDPNTITCIAIGPSKVEDVDAVTRNLPLL